VGASDACCGRWPYTSSTKGDVEDTKVNFETKFLERGECVMPHNNNNNNNNNNNKILK
jgi:hypothetical protein